MNTKSSRCASQNEMAASHWLCIEISPVLRFPDRLSRGVVDP